MAVGPAFAKVTLLKYEDVVKKDEVLPRTQMLLIKDEDVPQGHYVAKYQRDKMQQLQQMGKYREVNNCEAMASTREQEEISLMQRKRRRSPSPRRRRRERAARDSERLRQERRSAWTIRSSRDKVTTETCSRKALTAPWQRSGGGSRPSGTSRPSSAPSTVTRPRVPDVPPLGNGSANVVWWSEILGLQDAMGDNNRVLDEQTVEAVVDNLRSMEPRRRTDMIAQLLPFLGCFLAEILRAIHLAQLPPETDEPEYIEDDAPALMQQAGHPPPGLRH